MRILVGNVLIGKTDEFDYECIKTKFFFFGMPLFPVASFYITPYERRAALADRDSEDAPAPYVLPLFAVTPIRSHSKSISAAYARWWGIVAVLFSPVFAKGIWSFVAILVTGLIWLAFYFTSASTPLREKKERIAFSRSTGVAAWPEILYPDTAQKVYNKLQSAWKARHGKKSTERNWRTVAAGGLSTEDLCALYALCRYARVVEGNVSPERIEAVRDGLAAVDLGDAEVPAAKVSKPLLAFVLLLVGGPIALLVFMTRAKPVPSVEPTVAPARASATTSAPPKEPTRVAPSATASAPSVADSPLVYSSPIHGFSLTLPSVHWIRQQPSAPVVQFSTQMPMPMVASIVSVEKQGFEQYGNSLFAFATGISNQKGILEEPEFYEAAIVPNGLCQLTTYKKQSANPDQIVYTATSRSWLRSKQLTVIVRVEGEGMLHTSYAHLEVKQAVKAIGLSIKEMERR